MFQFLKRAFRHGKKQVCNSLKYHWDSLTHGCEFLINDAASDGGYENNGVFIVGSGKSGTTLLQALFDFHPNLLTLPIESGYYVDFNRVLQNKKNKRVLMQFFMYESKFSWMREKVFLKHSVEKYRDFSNVDFRTFQKTLFGYDMKRHSRKALYLHLLEAYRLSISARRETLYGFVDKTPLHVFHVDEIWEDFPEARFIHVVRDPLDNYHAYKSNHLAGCPDSEGRLLLQRYFDKFIYPAFVIADKNRKRKNYRIVRYEDIVAKPEEEMRSLAEWIGVPYAETMAEVTLCGRPWPGNSSSGKNLHGISTDRMGKGRHNLICEEVDYIKGKLEDLADNFGYFNDEDGHASAGS